ncbi:hypothetical protein SAMN05444279_10884 [Ruegeria intermedia]|uniref:Uncharacterized protein n=1 Tax=Ruegeria intermedia TaxID=996115 RepID=A0A1M4WCD6_9RHOB|nr:hypothetical protein [Ruegeria intermedia]SHE78928.1 hypothetical protein SAMN05444279_10884 [Ruegeria intermedia]
MHRKFIALVVATAVAITGVSASQAKAADAHDILGGLAAIAIIGAAVNHYNKEKRKERVARQNTHIHQPQETRPDHIRPLPRRVARYDLPQRCLKTYKGYSKNRPLLKPKCLEKHYEYANSLPQQCKVGFWNGKKIKRAYEPACLRQKGYRVVYQ